MSHPFIPAPNTALVEMVYGYEGQIIENTFHVVRNSPFDASALQSLTQNVFDVWDSTGTARFSAQRTADSVLTQVKGRALDTNSSPVYIYTLPGSGRPGVISSQGSLPGNCTFAITLQTGLAGRSYRGRIFIPGLNYAMLQTSGARNLVSAAQANAWIASVNSLIAQIAAIGSGYHLVVTSYYNNHAWRTTAVNSIVLNAAYADLAVDSQRRRLAYRGA